MEIINIEDNEGNLLLDFDGIEWKIYTEYDYENPEILDYEKVAESPFYLYQKLEEVGNPTEIMVELSQFSQKLKSLFEKFFNEKSQLKKRIVLFEQSGCGAIDEFIDRISLSGNQEEGFTIEATIEDDLSYDEMTRNALGEIQTVILSNIFDAEDIFEAIQEIASDERWDSINWTWSGICSNLKSTYPALADELKNISSEHGHINPRRVKNESFYFNRIEQFCNAQKFDLALDYANTAIEIFPFCDVLYATRGEVYFLKSNFAKAIKDYETAIQLGLDTLEVWNNLGLCFGAEGYYLQAIEYFNMAIYLDKTNPKTFLARAKAHRCLGNSELALMDEERASLLENPNKYPKKKEKALTLQLSEIDKNVLAEDLRILMEEGREALINRVLDRFQGCSESEKAETDKSQE